MADQSQLFLSLTDSESRPSTMSGIGTRGTHEKRPLQDDGTAEALVPVGHRKVCEKRPYTTSNPFSAFVVSR